MYNVHLSFIIIIMFYFLIGTNPFQIQFPIHSRIIMNGKPIISRHRHTSMHIFTRRALILALVELQIYCSECIKGKYCSSTAVQVSGRSVPRMAHNLVAAAGHLLRRTRSL